jgi:L-iditol 2-dehydrogenase
MDGGATAGPGGLPEWMRALVLSAPGRFGLEDVPRPEPGPHEVLCRVRAVSICGTDPHIVAGDYPGFWPLAFPHIPGHEWAGEVVALGADCAELGWRIGDRVAGTSHGPCGFCRACLAGRTNLCEQYGRPPLHHHYGHNAPGAYAGYVVHSVRSVFRIPETLSWDHACMLDPASIALHTVNRARLSPGCTVAVIGAGVQGLLGAECARVCGAGRVIVVGRGERLDMAGRLGYETVDAAGPAPVAAVRELTGGAGADAVLECAGTAQAVQMAVQMARRGARIAMVGIPLEDVVLPVQTIVLDEIDLYGVRASAGEMAQVIPLAASGRLRLDALITHRFPLEEFEAAYGVFTRREGGALKVILYPHP